MQRSGSNVKFTQAITQLRTPAHIGQKEEASKQCFGTLPPLSHQRLPQVAGRGNLTLLSASPSVCVRPHGPIRPHSGQLVALKATNNLRSRRPPNPKTNKPKTPKAAEDHTRPKQTPSSRRQDPERLPKGVAATHTIMLPRFLLGLGRNISDTQEPRSLLRVTKRGLRPP